MTPANPCRLVLSPGCEYCADCYEEARRISFDGRCKPCRLDIWVGHLNKREVLADNQPLKRCADCGSADLRRLTFKQWVARMAAIRKLQKKYDINYSRCEERSGARIQRLNARRNTRPKANSETQDLESD